MIDSIEIESEGVSFFTIIAVQGQSERTYRLGRSHTSGEWRLADCWIASAKVKWPDALARALKQIALEEGE